ncbi:peptidase family S64-domain-containing protein [Dipodascopsis tothii]|uniref:peptidase family S64-domain-containing protein n=1 Tax=Dipodascopsis tothii TaxID=44089 RepID=UPI0034CF3508
MVGHTKKIEQSRSRVMPWSKPAAAAEADLGFHEDKALTPSYARTQRAYTASVASSSSSVPGLSFSVSSSSAASSVDYGAPSDPAMLSLNPSGFFDSADMDGEDYGMPKFGSGVAMPMRQVDSRKTDLSTRMGSLALNSIPETSGGITFTSSGVDLLSRPSMSARAASMPTTFGRDVAPVINADLETLAKDIKDLAAQVAKHMMDLSKAASTMTQSIKVVTRACQTQMAKACDASTYFSRGYFSTQSHPSLGMVLKIVLHFADNLLLGLPFASSRSLLLRATAELGTTLHMMSSPAMLAHGSTAVPQPANFAIANSDRPSSVLDKLNSMMGLLSESSSFTVSDQDGAFVAPISRGFSDLFSIYAVLFGIPEPTDAHIESVTSLWDISDQIHFFCQKNHIAVCAGERPAEAAQPPLSMGAFRSPYRQPPTDGSAPPMSMSLAAEDADKLSGTLGGYVYPKVDMNDPAMAAYAQSAFAMTCAHVCLTQTPAGGARSAVSVPSPVLVNMYRDVLVREHSRYPPRSAERHAFRQAVGALDAQYPRQNSRSTAPRFGEILWGERTISQGSISDLAIIRCRAGVKPPTANALGDDIPFSEFDPALMFGNTVVRRVVNRLVPGSEVFKYGSTSKFTTGRLNGPRMIYWADGALQSSEFVVASPSPMFASGGDSGAWILQKPTDTSSSGLGVIGMLHAYDGEHREFGLFTPMTRILNRLREVTGIEWGVVGVKDVPEDESLVGGSESSASTSASASTVASDFDSDSDLDR